MYSSNSRKKCDKGQGLVEYALILVLVALVVIAALMILGPAIGNVFSQINNSLSVLSLGEVGGVVVPPAPDCSVQQDAYSAAMADLNACLAAHDEDEAHHCDHLQVIATNASNALQACLHP